MEADHLLRNQIARVIAAPNLDDELRGGYRDLGAELDVTFNRRRYEFCGDAQREERSFHRHEQAERDRFQSD